MLAMALPIALVRLMPSAEWRGRILYGLAACVLVAASFATYRKTALLAPLSAVLTLAYFRRRELLKLAPLGVVLVGLVSIVLSARKIIAARDPVVSPVALAGAAATVVFLTVSALFDVLSFPHATYIFLFTAGLVAVVVTAPPEEEEEEQAHAAPPVDHQEGRVRWTFRDRRLSPKHPAGRSR